MPVEPWNESGRVWEEDHGLLDEEQVARCAVRGRGGVPPLPGPDADDLQRRVHAGRPDRRAEAGRVADPGTSRRGEQKLGISRRQFLCGSGGMAAALLAMNDVFGRFFDVDPDRDVRTGRRTRRRRPPKDLFVFDDQLHLVRGSQPPPADLRALAQGPSSAPVHVEPLQPARAAGRAGDVWGVWNPALVGLPIDPANAQHHAVHQGRLPGQPGHHRAAEQRHRLHGPRWTASRPGRRGTSQEALARRDPRRPPRPPPRANFVNADLRLHAHAGPRPALRRQGQSAVHPGANRQATSPTRGRATTSRTPPRWTTIRNSLMRQWRHDDEEVAYPTFELIQKSYDRLKGEEAGVQQYLRAQRPGPRPAGPEARPPGRHAQGGARLAEAQLHHLSRLHPAELLPVRHAARR